MKRTFVFGALFVALMLVISACGTPATPPPATTAPAATSAPAQATAAPAATTAAAATAAPAATTASAATAAPAATTASSGGADDWGTVTVKKGDTIKIDLSAALTGDLAPFGQDILAGAQLAADQYGKDVQPGFNIEIVSDDDQCSGPGGTTVANKVASDPQIVGVVGLMCSSGEIPGTEILDKAHIASISPSATAVDVTNRGLQSVFRTASNDAVQGPADADFVFNQLKLNSIAILHDGSPYGEGLGKAFQAAFEKLGGKVTDFEAVTVGDKDYRATLTKIAANQPQGIFFGGFHPEAAVIATQKAEVGLQNATLISDDGTYSPKFFDEAKDAAEGVYASFGSAQQGSTYSDFVTAYEAKGNKKENIVYGPQAYDAAHIFALALKQVAKVDADGNLTVGRKALADAIRATTLDGVTGKIAFDANGDRPAESTSVAVFKAEGGKWVQVWPAPSASPTTAPASGGATATPGAAAALPDLGGKDITVALEDAYIPFNYIRLDNGKAEGWDYDALAEICKRLNCKPDFKEIAWDGMITAVSQGQFDVAADGITITPDRAKVVDFSQGYLNVDQRVMVRADESRWKSANDLKGVTGIKVATQKGTTNYDAAVALVGADQVTGFDSFGDAVQALINKDADALVIDDTAGQGYIGVNANELKLLDGSLISQDLGFVFPKGSALVPAFNGALDAMKADGTLEALRAKWFPQGKPVIGGDQIGAGAYAATPTPTP